MLFEKTVKISRISLHFFRNNASYILLALAMEFVQSTIFLSVHPRLGKMLNERIFYSKVE